MHWKWFIPRPLQLVLCCDPFPSLFPLSRPVWLESNSLSPLSEPWTSLYPLCPASLSPGKPSRNKPWNFFRRRKPLLNLLPCSCRDPSLPPGAELVWERGKSLCPCRAVLSSACPLLTLPMHTPMAGKQRRALGGTMTEHIHTPGTAGMLNSKGKQESSLFRTHVSSYLQVLKQIWHRRTKPVEQFCKYCANVSSSPHPHKLHWILLYSRVFCTLFHIDLECCFQQYALILISSAYGKKQDNGAFLKYVTRCWLVSAILENSSIPLKP